MGRQQTLSRPQRQTQRGGVHAGRTGREEEGQEGDDRGEEMTSCLYDCLREVGLQCHYARFTSLGVLHAVQLSCLSMEDYPSLGVHSMEDRTRLFHLVQLVKTLELGGQREEEDDGEDDDDYDGENGVGVGEEDDGEEEDVAATSLRQYPVRRRLDFSGETVDQRLRHFDSPKGSVDVHTRRYSGRNHRTDKCKEPSVCKQQDFDVVVSRYRCQRNYNKLNAGGHHHTSAHRAGATTKLGIMRRSPVHNSRTRSSPVHMSAHKTSPRHNPRHTTVAWKRCSNKPANRREGNGSSRKGNPHTGIEDHGTCRQMTKPTPVYESRRTPGYNYGLPMSVPSSPNKQPAGGQRISVCVRKRPLTHAEERRGEDDVVSTQDGGCVMVHETKEAVDLTHYILQHRFYFDQVFGERSSNEEVYRRTACPLVQHVLSGGKATCFAYGQTGAGKTHTMLGSSAGRPGLYALAAHDIFTHLSANHTLAPPLVFVSFFEIYCGQLYDLLDHRKRLFAREDGQKVVQIAGLREVRVDSVSSLLQVISWGTEVRTQGVSGVNPVSSRSHALLQIQIKGLEPKPAGRLWFVDLAGSERAVDSRDPDRRSRMEGAEINQSLLALKECIRSLDQEQSHTPFRQSKLTQVLKDSFVGNSKTCMIANISPGHLATEHTLNTLRYADRVKELRGKGGGGEGRVKGTSCPKHTQTNINTNTNSSSGGSVKGRPAPKHTNTNSSSSSLTRGKSPLKRPKLGGQREAPGLNTPTRRAATGGTVLCSTPKNSRGGRGEEISLEHITPVRRSVGMVGGREGGGEREMRERQRREEEERYSRRGDRGQRREGGGERERRDGEKERRDEEKNVTRKNRGQVNTERNTGAGLVARQPLEEQVPTWNPPREGGASAIQYSTDQRTAGICQGGGEERQREEGGREEQRRWREEGGPVRRSSENRGGMINDRQRDRGEIRERECDGEREGNRERESEREKERKRERESERERHLRWYHQQLQQFQPSSTSSSVHSFLPPPSVHPSPSPSTNPSLPSSTNTSLSHTSHPSLSPSTDPSLSPSTHPSLPPPIFRALEDLLSVYTARVEWKAEMRGNKLHSHRHTGVCESSQSHSYHDNDDDDDDDDDEDAGSFVEERRIPVEETEAGGGEERGSREEWTSSEARGGGEERGRGEEWRSLGVGGGGRVERGRRGEGRLIEMEGGQSRGAWGPSQETTEMLFRSRGEESSPTRGPGERSRPSEDGSSVQDIFVEDEWSTEEEEEEVDSYGLGSIESSNNNSLFHHLQPPHAHPYHPYCRAPAERPLSPVCRCTNNPPPPVELNDLSMESKLTNHSPDNLLLQLHNVNPAQDQQGPALSAGQGASGRADSAVQREMTNLLLPPTTIPHPSTQMTSEVSVESRQLPVTSPRQLPVESRQLPFKTLSEHSEDPTIVSTALIASPPIQNRNHTKSLLTQITVPYSSAQTKTELPAESRSLPSSPFDKRSEYSVVAPTVSTASTPAQTHKQSEAEDKMSVSSQDECPSDSFNITMDPLSLSPLQVERRAGTDSFLLGEQTSTCPLEEEEKRENNRGGEEEEEDEVSHTGMDEVKGREDEEGELLGVKTGCVPSSNTVMADQEDCSGGSIQLRGTGLTKPFIPVAALLSFQHQGDCEKDQPQSGSEVLGYKHPACPLRPSAHLHSPTSLSLFNSHTVQGSGDTISSDSKTLASNLPTQTAPRNTHHKPVITTTHTLNNTLSTHNPSILTSVIPRLRSDLVQSNTAPRHCQAVISDISREPYSPLTVSSSTEPHSLERSSSQHTGPTIHLSTQEDLEHAQRCVVQGHWDQMAEMKSLCLSEGALLCRQPHMEFAQYVARLEEILARKAQSIQTMRSQLQLYLRATTTDLQDTHNHQTTT